MIAFCIVVIAIVLVTRWGVRQQSPERAEVWKARADALVPIVNHVVADVRAVRTNARARRIMRHAKKKGWDL